MSANRAFPVAGVVIGAGAGTRFGEPKATARLPHGSTFLETVCATALDAGLSPLVAVLPPGVAVQPGVIAVANAGAAGEQIVSVRLDRKSVV